MGFLCFVAKCRCCCWFQLWQKQWWWLRNFGPFCDSLFVGRQFLRLLHKITVLSASMLLSLRPRFWITSKYLIITYKHLKVIKLSFEGRWSWLGPTREVSNNHSGESSFASSNGFCLKAYDSHEKRRSTEMNSNCQPTPEQKVVARLRHLPLLYAMHIIISYLAFTHSLLHILHI